MKQKGKKHPDKIVESASLAAIPMPDITYQDHLPQQIIYKGLLSGLQLEAVIYACQRWFGRPNYPLCHLVQQLLYGILKWLFVVSGTRQNSRMGAEQASSLVTGQVLARCGGELSFESFGVS